MRSEGRQNPSLAASAAPLTLDLLASSTNKPANAGTCYRRRFGSRATKDARPPPVNGSRAGSQAHAGSTSSAQRQASPPMTFTSPAGKIGTSRTPLFGPLNAISDMA